MANFACTEESASWRMTNVLSFCEAISIRLYYNAAMKERLGLPENIDYISFLLRSEFRGILVMVLLLEAVEKGIPAIVQAGIELDNRLGKLVTKDQP